MSQYMELRNKWPEFVYEGYEIEETGQQITVRYQFQIPGLAAFAPEWKFPKCAGLELLFRDDPVFQNIIFSLGMVELISYWKICCPPTVLVRAGTLETAQITWWKNLYYHGLGEFFYTNHIQEASPDTFMEIRCAGAGYESGGTDRRYANSMQVAADAPGETKSDAADLPEVQDNRVMPPLTGCMIPIGGGKDSVVTIELVKKTGMASKAYIINPRGATRNCAAAGGYGPEQIIAASRTLDANMLRLNREGYLNGHTPFSAIVAFSAIAAAYLHRLRYVALSNESSANESTVPGSTVNHQYSKSFQFEADFHAYEQRYLQSGVSYFSLLRPLSEFQIARYFAGLKPYHTIFRSCNVGSRQDIWCGHCPKCLFVCLILAPFLSRAELTGIFGRDLLDDASLIGTLEQLVGIQEEKPFECVGSRDEVNTAIAMTIQRMEKERESCLDGMDIKNRELPTLLEYYKQTGRYQQYAGKARYYETFYDEKNLLPGPFAEILQKECMLNSCKAR